MFSLFQRIPSISTKELETLLSKQNITLLDVRNTSEYRIGHIQKAINFPLSKIHSYKGNNNEPIYVICQSGMRSKNAAKQLKKIGYNVINVRGGMSQWAGKIRGGK